MLALLWSLWMGAAVAVTSTTDVDPDGTRVTCVSVPVLRAGAVAGNVCANDAEAQGLVVVDLDDDWAPHAFSESPYRALWIALQNEHIDVVGAHAPDDRFFELWGIAPSVSVVRARLLDAPRHACHALVHDDALAALTRTLRSGNKSDLDAMRALQGHLVCDGFLRVDDASKNSWPATARALALWKRRESLPTSPDQLDLEARDRLVLSSEERDLRALLRVLRERVVDATDLIEDGTASGTQHAVVDRVLDPESMRVVRVGPTADGAPDLVDNATDVAARALGWVDAATARTALDTLPLHSLVAIPLPAALMPNHAVLDVTMHIDRGALRPNGMPVPGGRGASYVITVGDASGSHALVSWPTTTGGRHRAQSAGSVYEENMPSPQGDFAYRYLWVAPSWYPPADTPDDDLLLHFGNRVVVNEEAIGPGYRSAYGLMVFQHARPAHRRDGTTRYDDTGIRTHGTGSYRSVLLGGTSHGCHRLLPRSAIRLAGFLMRHRAHTVDGVVHEGWQRKFVVGTSTLVTKRDARGVRVEFTPPVPVEVR